jgi:hypothetical protein
VREDAQALLWRIWQHCANALFEVQDKNDGKYCQAKYVPMWALQAKL